MTLSQEQFEKVRGLLPVQRGNVVISNLQLLNAVLYVVENGCKWRSLPPPFGKWHTVYTRLRRWQKKGVLERVFRALQEQQIVTVTLQVLGLDSTSVKVHPDGAGALKKTARKPSDAVARSLSSSTAADTTHNRQCFLHAYGRRDLSGCTVLTTRPVTLRSACSPQVLRRALQESDRSV